MTDQYYFATSEGFRTYWTPQSEGYGARRFIFQISEDAADLCATKLRKLSSLSVQRGTSPSSNPDVSDYSVFENGKGPLGLNMISSVSEPVADFIFVHGLGGGSRKTWAKSKKDGQYWPKEWLAKDPYFQNVRLHSFGYNADWQEMKDSILDIKDFALSLLGEIQDNPGIRKSSTRIVLIGHSMGGIVIKKLYILARQDPTFKELARRIHSLYFLATPHRGSDVARNLNRIISFALRKPYVSELIRNSSSIATINDAFRQYMEDLKLWSFYETLPTRIGIIVDKESATLGYKKERIALLNADHRGVCKFSSPCDPNYRTLRNALSTTVDTIVSEGAQISEEACRAEICSVSALTGVSDRPEDDLMLLDDTRMSGSCEWFTTKKEFTDWQSPCADAPPLFWLSGSAATGKSVLTSHVIRRLETQKLSCSYFFFKHNSTGRSSVADCLRSLAFQMACSDESARSKLLKLKKDDTLRERGDEQAVWRKLFLRCLFLTSSSQPHFWVIDGLDECSNFQSFFPLFSRIPKYLRIFMSSRNMQDIEQGFAGLGDLVLHKSICVSDTIEDIRLFIASKMDKFPIGYDDNRKTLQDRIIAKSAGSFLWVHLVVQELEHTFSEEAIEDVLNEIPPDMNQLYARILTNMTKETRGINLARAILTWSVCASTPLSVHQLQYALKLDINETVHHLERSVASVCGQFIFIDHSSRVQIIHQTAKDFLIQQSEVPQFAIDRKLSHARLASICLQFLAGDWFKSQSHHGQKAATGLYPGANFSKRGKPDDSKLKSAFADYACHFFSEHLYKSSSQDSSILAALSSFLSKNVLSWIEYIARTGDLCYLTLTAKNMKAFLERRKQYSLPISREVETVEAWVIDLIRVTAKFRTQLLASPSSIYSLIPSICPSDSIIAKTYSSRQRGLLIKGLKTQMWDDCLARIDFQGAQTTTIAHGERLFAIGLSNSKIRLYDIVSLQEKGSVDHGERVKILRFSNEDKFLLSSSLRHTRLWNPVSCTLIWSFTTFYQAVALMFIADDELINLACRDNCIRTIKAFDGVEINCVDLIGNCPDDFLGRQPLQSASLAVFSSDCNMLALSHRGRAILVFDIENDKLPISYSREAAMSPLGHYTVDSMTFNPNPEINVLIASYGDGELTVYDLWSTEPKHRLNDVFAHSLVCSPDGKSLVTGSSSGTIQIFDFGGASGDKLSLIYQIDAHEHGIKALSFSQDSLRIVDIRASQCCIWEPAALIRKDFDEGSYSEISQPLPLSPKRSNIIENSSNAEITSICCHKDGKTVFCGRQDGAILCHRTADGGEEGMLYSHATNIGIIALALASAQDLKIISADESGRLIIKKISIEEGHWSECGTVADIRFNESIATILVNAVLDRLLVTGKDIDLLLDLQGNQICKRESTDSRAAIYHPLHQEFFIMLGPRVARLFEWASFEEITGQDGIKLERPDESAYADGAGCVLVQDPSALIESRKVLGKRSTNLLNFWPSSEFEADSESITSTAGFERLGPRIENIIDVLGTVLYFLDIDLWVCSVDLRTFRTSQQLKRHFFVPSEWRSSTGRLLVRLTSRLDFVFAKHDEFVVVKRGLEFAEMMELSDLPARKSQDGE